MGSGMFPPQRIVCLTEETVETLYLLGEQDRIVGISGYAVRPPEARRDKPRVSAFTSADLAKIEALRPDLVLAFSDLQADIVAELIRGGVAVHAFNQRDLAGIFDMIRTVGALVGAARRAPTALAARLDKLGSPTRRGDLRRRARPRAPDFFRGMGRALDLRRYALGLHGIDRDRRRTRCTFPTRSREGAAKAATASGVTADELQSRLSPDIIIGSWCGKKFRPGAACRRAPDLRCRSRRSATGAACSRSNRRSIVLQPGVRAHRQLDVEKIVGDWAAIGKNRRLRDW